MLRLTHNQVSLYLFPVGLLVAILLMVGCELGPSFGNGDADQPGQLSGKLTLSGSSTLAPLVVEAASQFEAMHPAVRIEVQTGGSSRGIRDVRTGVVNLGMASRALKPDEAADCIETIIAWDGVGFLVHRDNPVTALNREQLIDVYTGNLKHWNELGGHDAPIIVSNRAEGRSELDLVTQYLKLKPTQIRASVIDGETQQSIKTVVNNANAITFTSIGAAQHAIEQGVPLRLLPLDGIEATTNHVRSRNYPLARPLILIRPKTSPAPSELETAFLQFMTSPAVEATVTGLGFVPASR